MPAPRSVLPCLALLATLAACAPDRSSPLQVTDPLLSAEGSAPRLESVEPARAVYTDTFEVTIRGTGLSSNVTGVTIGTVAAAKVTHVNGSTIRALFEGGTSSARVGRHAVAVHFGNGKSATLANAFLWKYDHDPVVFVHGCPLPPELDGSVTNYVTSKYWHALYDLLQGEPDGAGYPAPSWDSINDFVASYDHPATLSAPANYLNVFVLSEDSRTPHSETARPTGPGGHCGSGLQLADELSRFVDEVLAKTGADRVDLVVNSGSGLGARWFLRGLGGTGKVRDVVFLAAMNHGTDVALVPTVYDKQGNWWSPNYEMAREGFPAYACKGQGRGGSADYNEAGRDLQDLVNGCFANPARLGDGSFEIPDDHRNTAGKAGGVAYLSIYNATVDELIEPTTSACLNQKVPGDCSDLDINVPVHAYAPGQTPESRPENPHHAIRLDPEVLDLTACWLKRRSPVRPSPVRPSSAEENCADERLAAMTKPPGM